MIPDKWTEELVRGLPRKADYWIGDVVQDGPGNQWEIVDLAYSPSTDTFLYKVDRKDEPDYAEQGGWKTESEVPAVKTVEEADRPEPLAYEFEVDNPDPSEIDKRLDALEAAKRQSEGDNK